MGEFNTPQIRKIAKWIGRDQALAERLWATSDPDARVLATFVGDPKKIAPETADLWVADLDSWGICDACCFLFDRTPWAWRKVREWAEDEREFVRRAAFATIAAIAVHDKTAPDEVFLDALPLIEKYAFDGRNFVRKGVNWALRNVGKRNESLRPAVLRCAERIRAQGTSSARWIAAGAIRELTGSRKKVRNNPRSGPS
jgi:3-methyladenine DNA glycosylase AlkD